MTEECIIHNSFDTFKLRVFRIEVKPDVIKSIVVIYMGLIKNGCLTRINSACITSETFGDTNCDCKWQLDETFRLISKARSGLIIYISHHEGRGVGLFHKVQSMHLMQLDNLASEVAFKRLHLVPDARNYDFVMPILNWFGLQKITMITNNPDKIKSIQQLGICITERIPLVTTDPLLKAYLVSKQKRQGHIISFAESPNSSQTFEIKKKEYNE